MSKKRVKFTVLKETGNPFNLFLSHSRYHDLALLAIKGFFDYGIVKDPKEVLLKLIKEGIRPIIATSLEYRPVKKVLIVYSGSMESAKAMKRFVQLRPWNKCKINIVCYEKPEKEAETLLSDVMRYCNSHGLKI
ncbi:MAG: hypothetical protein SVR08_17735 [Spirochaetota bacterium]|nr:hypothetical protein [Spirochaetota bacterium]